MISSVNIPLVFFVASSVISVIAIKFRVKTVTKVLPFRIQPTEPHQTLTENNIKSRVIIVGDVHGCLDELQQLLLKCKYTDDDKIVLVRKHSLQCCLLTNI